MRLVNARPFRWLDFDIENRPLSYLGHDFTTAEVTAIAWSWVGEDEVHCELLTKRSGSAGTMLKRFRQAYDRADGLTGHYIRRHDLPIVNGALLELGMKLLGPKLTCDTKADLRKAAGVSKSQESLADMLEVEEEKHHMSQRRWRSANRLTAEGLEQTRIRVSDDVRQHKELRAALLEAGALGAPRMWHP